MPNIPWFRDWFENKFGDLCNEHDKDYMMGRCKLCSDCALVNGIIKLGFWWLVIPVFIAVNLPWVWIKYYKKRRKG